MGGRISLKFGQLTTRHELRIRKQCGVAGEFSDSQKLQSAAAGSVADL
jgi:hypothetical protein